MKWNDHYYCVHNIILYWTEKPEGKEKQLLKRRNEKKAGPKIRDQDAGRSADMTTGIREFGRGCATHPPVISSLYDKIEVVSTGIVYWSGFHDRRFWLAQNEFRINKIRKECPAVFWRNHYYPHNIQHIFRSIKLGKRNHFTCRLPVNSLILVYLWKCKLGSPTVCVCVCVCACMCVCMCI